MVSLSLQQSLWLYMWFPLTALLVFLLLIARFYQKFSGVKTYYEYLGVAIILFGIAFVRYASLNQLSGDLFADVLFGVGGLILIGFCVRLYRIMILQASKN